MLASADADGACADLTPLVDPFACGVPSTPNHFDCNKYDSYLVI